MAKQLRFTQGDETQFTATEVAPFPSTRFQGSKRDLTDWIWTNIETEFDSLLDAFGGTGAISHHAKKYGKTVHYNDYLAFNHEIGKALIENDTVTLTKSDIDFLLTSHDDITYGSVIQDKFDGLYYTDEENQWLDRMQGNIAELDNEYKRAIAYASVSQSCLAKRPYNLFHRANLDMRTRDVDRSFGNKTTWDTPFEDHFRTFAAEYNDAVFDNGRDCRSHNKDIMTWSKPPETDLVYLDPPYYDRRKDNGSTNYHYYYHFLEGFHNYNEWRNNIDTSVKTNRLEQDSTSPWTDPSKIHDAFEHVFDLFSDRQIVVSYNTAGTPTPDTLVGMLQERKDTVTATAKEQQYALSTKSDSPDEVLIHAYDEK